MLALLEAGGVLRRQQLVQASEASQAVLQEVHTPRYLAKLNSSSFTVAQVWCVCGALPALPDVPARPA